MAKKLYFGDAWTRLGRCECHPIEQNQLGRKHPIAIVTNFGSVEADEVSLYDEEAVNALCRKGIDAYREKHGRPPITAPAWLLSTDEASDQLAEQIVAAADNGYSHAPTLWDGMPIVERYTFASQFGTGRDWLQSSQRFTTMEDAAKAAAAWLIVSAENGLFASVRVESVTELGAV